MREVFVHIWALQQLDTELKTLSVKLADVPARIVGLKSAAGAIKADLDSAKAAILEHRKQYKLAELEVKAAEEKIAGYNAQLYSSKVVKTNEQFKAFLKEIEAQKKLKSQTEDKMIVLMEETEALDRKVRENEKKSVELAADTARKVQMLEAEKGELDAAIAERTAQRQTLTAAIPADVLKRYERIRHSKNGIAVVLVRKDRCSGCLSPIPAQRVLEVERQDRLYNCEACGRLLVTAKD
jgi:predicted  nucleic acid-binding Zn-ribbon protein